MIKTNSQGNSSKSFQEWASPAKNQSNLNKIQLKDKESTPRTKDQEISVFQT
jgi:hypothetical protein